MLQPERPQKRDKVMVVKCCMKEDWMRLPWDVLLEAERDNESTSEWVTAYHGTNISVLYEIMASKGLNKGTLARPNNTRNSLN